VPLEVLTPPELKAMMLLDTVAQALEQ
jgi:hypothetical protein